MEQIARDGPGLSEVEVAVRDASIAGPLPVLAVRNVELKNQQIRL